MANGSAPDDSASVNAGTNNLQSSVDSLNTSVQNLTRALGGASAGTPGTANNAIATSFLNGAFGKGITWGSNGNGGVGGGGSNILGNALGGGSAPNGGTGGFLAANGGVKGLAAGLAGQGVNFLFKSATGFQSPQQVITNAMTYQTIKSMWSTFGAPKVVGGTNMSAGMYGSQGPTDFFGGLSILQSLGGWTSGVQFKDMQSAVGGSQALNPTLSYSQIAGSVGQFASLPQTNALRMYGINTYNQGKFTGSVQNIALQLMNRMGIKAGNLTAQQVAEEGGPNGPIAQQLSMMVSNGAISADQAELVREQMLAYIQGGAKGLSPDQVQKAQSNYANTGSDSTLSSLGYGKSPLAKFQHTLTNGTSLDMKTPVQDAASALSDLAGAANGLTGIFSSLLSGNFGGAGSALSGLGSGLLSGGKKVLGSVGSALFGSGAAYGAEPSAPSAGSSYAASMSGGAIKAKLTSVGSQPNSCLADLAQALLGRASGYSGPNQAWNDIPNGHAHPGDKNPPVGAVVYWGAHAGNKYGHIGVVTKPGVFTSAGLSDHWEDNPMSWESSNYLGWSDTIGKWPLPYTIKATGTKGTPPKINPSASVSGSLSQAQIYQLALQAGLSPQSAKVASAIAMAESAGKPGQDGDLGLQNATWGPSEGLWQIRTLKAQYGKGTTRDGSRLHDANYNAQAMAAISSGGTNFGAWTTYTDGAYKQYMNFNPNSIVIHIHGEANRTDATALADKVVKKIVTHHRMKALAKGEH